MARVMVIEDEALLLASYERALRRGRHAVIPVHEGAGAAGRAQAERPDLILVDLHVPGLDPVAFIRALKGDPATALIPIIVVSGITPDRQMLDQLSPGWIEEVWLKPVRMERLLQRANAITDDRATDSGRPI
jgi:CheY-like chemotaxis protein